MLKTTQKEWKNMHKRFMLLAAGLALTVFAGEKIFPEANEVDPLIRYRKNSKVEVAPDGTFRVDGKIHYFLTAHVFSATPVSGTRKVPGAPASLDWLYKDFPDYDQMQRIGFDCISTTTYPRWILEYSKTFSSGLVSDSPKVRKHNRQIWESGLPVYVDITGFAWGHGALAHATMGCRRDAIPDEARNTNLKRSGDRWASYAFMHPAGRELYRKMWTDAANFAKEHNAKVLAYELFNESGYNDPSAYNRRLFVDYLNKKYHTPAEMNRIWKSDYASFEAASQFQNQRENLGLFVDWAKFMEDCVVDLCKFGQKEILKIDPDAYVTNQIQGRGMFRTVSRNNFNMYRISKVLNAVVYPTLGPNFQCQGLSKEPSHTLDVRDISSPEGLVTYAFYKVLAEGKPLFNNENYANKGSSIFNAVWQDAIHGSGMTNFWSWGSGVGRLKIKELNEEGMKKSALTYYFELLNPFVKKPEELAEFAAAKKEIAEFGDFFLPRDRGVKTETALLLSFPTQRRHDFKPNRPDVNLLPLYVDALYFSHYPADVIAEEHLAEGRASRYKVIIAPGVSNAMPGTVKHLMEFAENGGVVVFVRNFMEKDEYDNPNPDWKNYSGWQAHRVDTPVFPSSIIETAYRSPNLPGELKGRPSAAARFKGEWEAIGKCGKNDAIYRKKCGKGWIYAVMPELRQYPAAAILGGILSRHGVKPPLELATANGSELVPNVEMHVSRLNGKYAAFLFNYDSYPKLITLKPEKERAAFDLVNRRSLPAYKGGFLYLLPPQSRGIIAFGDVALYATFGPFTPTSEQELRAEKAKIEEELERQRKSAKTLYSPRPERTYPLNLRPFCNRDYMDSQAGDGQGGWADEGIGLAYTPTEPEKLQGVIFDFIRHDQNEYKACIVLKSTRKNNTDLPQTVENIPVKNKVQNIFFFHTLVYAAKGKKDQVLTYRIHYIDGESVDVPIRNGMEIGDWFIPVVPPEMKKQIAWQNNNQSGFFVWKWENPRPDTEIRSLDIISAVTPAVPIVLGITVEETAPDMKQINNEEEFAEFFTPEAGSRKILKSKLFLENTDGEGMRLRTHEAHCSFISRKEYGEGTFSMELKNEKNTQRLILRLLEDPVKKSSCRMTLNFKTGEGTAVYMQNGKIREKKDFSFSRNVLDAPFLLAGTYAGDKVIFKLNGKTLSELSVPSGMRGRVGFNLQNWWGRLYIRKISVE